MLWRQPVAAFQTECMCETGVKQEILDEFYKYRQMPDDPCFKCFLKCLGSKIQVYTSTGNLDVKRWSELFAYLTLPLAEKCANIVEPDVCQKAYLLVKCVNDALSEQFSL